MARIVQLLDGVTTAQFEIDKPEIRIGRSPECDVYIDDPSVSNIHCVIETVPPRRRDPAARIPHPRPGQHQRHLCQHRPSGAIPPGE